MAMETDAILDLIRSSERIEMKLDMLLEDEAEDEMEDSEEDSDETETEMESDDMLTALFMPMGGGGGAMADSSYDSSTATYDGLPRTGSYNGGSGL